MAALFALTLFTSAALLFVVQPLAGKQLLPLAGGTPAVWNTCLVFFQACLLLGYLYADRAGRAPRWVHAVAILAAGAALALGGGLAPDPRLLPADAAYPALGVLAVLAASVGVPFVVLSATAPLVQSWFAAAGRANPYPLYAASNAGSLLGLFGYPLLVEPNLTLPDQRTAWAVGFAACAALILACGWAGRNPSPTPPLGREGLKSSGLAPPLPPGEGVGGRGLRRRLRWAALAALPSAFLMTSTAHLTTDVAPMPLLWVVPLGVYLLSFVVVFARWPDAARRVVGRATPMALCFLTVALLMGATEPLPAVAAIHLGALALVCLLCHGELARDRPGPADLTQFYLWMSAGGVAGGLLVALVAPVVFSSVGNAEYPLAVVLAALVRPKFADAPPPRWRASDVLYPLGLAVLTVGLLAVVPRVLGTPPADDPGAELLDRVARGGLTAGLPAATAFALAWRPVRFGLALAAVFLAGALAGPQRADTLLVARNYFGTLRVSRSPDGAFTQLAHGTTLHGQQRAAAAGPPEPLMYYHRKGPLGRLFTGLPADRLRRVAVVGLGCGATAAYAKPGQRWTFYEIDPNVVRIARDERFFTFLSASAGDVDVVLGDARRQLAAAADGAFDLIVLDAFSSDAVPAHLLTREAFALYFAKLAPGGVIAAHVSNRYLDLAPLVARVAAAAEPGVAVRWENDTAVTAADRADGKFPSIWVGVARRGSDFGKLSAAWQPLTPAPGPVWADDFSNLLGVWKRGDD